MPPLPSDADLLERQITATLARLGVDRQDVLVTPLPGGLTNCNFRVSLPDGDVVLRIGGAETALMGIDRVSEHAATHIAWQLGVGAEIVFADAKADVLVTRFITGDALTIERARQAPTLARVAAAVRVVHDGPAFLGHFSPFVATRRTLELAQARGVEPPAEMKDALAVLSSLERTLGRVTDPRPCHNDLLAANFLDDGTRMRLIDWEYAGMGDRFFDLGNLAVNLELDPEDHATLLLAYGLAPDAENLARVALMRLASDLREASWGYLQTAVATLGYDYRAYGDRHLARFLVGARDQAFPAWLAAVEG